MSDRTMGSTSYTGVGGAAGSISDIGCSENGRALVGVILDLIADPEGTTGVEGEPTDGVPVGAPLSLLGPEGAPEEVDAPKIRRTA